MIDPTKYTAHELPGKFEGETAATEYFYEQSLKGDGETLFATHLDEEQDDYWETGNSAELFHIDAEESEAFNLPIGHWFLLVEDSQGFVMGSCHESQEGAEKEFRAWLGL
jgi:hypothetical protein